MRHPFSDENLAAACMQADALGQLLEPWNTRNNPCDLPAFVERNEHVYLAFSGGKDSLVLAHMLAPWAHKTSLVWANSGLMLPEAEAFVRGYGERFDLVEITLPSVLGEWAVQGIPSELLTDRTGERATRLQPWSTCCAMNRLAPIGNFLRKIEGQIGFVFSHRRTDSASVAAQMLAMLGPNVETENPLWSWSDDDVMQFLKEHDIALPPHYAAGIMDSMDCGPCPVRMTATRLAYLEAKDPQLAQLARNAGEVALEEAAEAWRALSGVFTEKGRAN